MSNDKIFRKNEDGSVVFVGDFDGLYKSEADPWGQSGSSDDKHRNLYYMNSRKLLVNLVNNCTQYRVGQLEGLEIGCGHGHVTSFLNLNSSVKFKGIDISPAAIKEARSIYPDIDFKIQDWTKLLYSPFEEPEQYFDVIVLGQIWWYILKDIDAVISNCASLLKRKSALIVQQAFLPDQKYFKDVADGFWGAGKLLEQKAMLRFELDAMFYDCSNDLPYKDGVFVLRRK